MNLPGSVFSLRYVCLLCLLVVLIASAGQVRALGEETPKIEMQVEELLVKAKNRELVAISSRGDVAIAYISVVGKNGKPEPVRVVGNKELLFNYATNMKIPIYEFSEEKVSQGEVNELRNRLIVKTTFFLLFIIAFLSICVVFMFFKIKKLKRGGG